jgi:hypothetical protein
MLKSLRGRVVDCATHPSLRGWGILPPISSPEKLNQMKKTSLIEAMARSMWMSNPRVNLVSWADGDVQLKDLYRIMAAAAVPHAKDLALTCPQPETAQAHEHPGG